MDFKGHFAVGRVRRHPLTVMDAYNGPPFASRPPGGLSRLSAWWLKLGIRHERIDRFRAEYNHERPHEALGQQAPVSCYEPSRRPLPEPTWGRDFVNPDGCETETLPMFVVAQGERSPRFGIERRPRRTLEQVQPPRSAEADGPMRPRRLLNHFLSV